MITNTIQGQKFDELVEALKVAKHGDDIAEAKANLVVLIDSWGVGMARKAVEEFKALYKYRGLVACNERALDLVLSSSQVPRDLMNQFNEIKTDEFKTDVKIEDLTQPFVVNEDPDLDTLLNATAALLSGRANMDVGIHWHESLMTVLGRLKQAQPESEPVDVERNHVAESQVRVRVHSVIDKTLGREVLMAWKKNPAVQTLLDPELTAQLLNAVATEFGGSLPTDVQQRMIAGSTSDFIDQLFIALDAMEPDEPNDHEWNVGLNGQHHGYVNAGSSEAHALEVAKRKYPGLDVTVTWRKYVG